MRGVGADVWTLGAVAPVLVLRVFADAMRCDIDDVNADQRHGTRTFANTFGVQFAWRGALVLDGVCGTGGIGLGTSGWLERLDCGRDYSADWWHWVDCVAAYAFSGPC